MSVTNVHLEGALPAAERFGQPLSRKALRQFRGPGSAIYPMLSQLCLEDVYVFGGRTEEFEYLNSSLWAVEDASEATVPSVIADTASGRIGSATSATDNAWIRIRTADNLQVFNTDHRPTVQMGFSCSVFDSDDDLLKVEVGFFTNVGDADNAAADEDAGQVAIKSTPTANVNNFAVAILDTDDNIFWDVISDVGGTTTTTNNGAGPLWDAHDDVLQHVMISLNEQDEARAWVNGDFIGKATGGPGAGVSLGLCWFLQNREGETRTGSLDYIRAWQERTPVL